MGLYSKPLPLAEEPGVQGTEQIEALPIVTEGAESSEVLAGVLKEGDPVVWKGFNLHVIEIRPDGCIRAGNLNWHVTVSDRSLFMQS